MGWDGVTNPSLNTQSRTGSWANDGNFTTAIHFGPSVSVRTLTLPAAGGRTDLGSTSVVENRGNSGRYWSSDEAGIGSWFLNFTISTATTEFQSSVRTNGMSVRCIAE